MRIDRSSRTKTKKPSSKTTRQVVEPSPRHHASTKLERMTLNFTPSQRALLEQVRVKCGVKSDGEVMRQAFSLHANLFERVERDEIIVLRHFVKGDHELTIPRAWVDRDNPEGRDGVSRRVLGLRVTPDLRASVEGLVSRGAAPTITLLAERALDNYEEVFTKTGEGWVLLARSKVMDYSLNPDGTLASNFGGTIIDIHHLPDHQEYTKDFEYVRQLHLKDIVTNTRAPIRALTLDCGDYLSRFWSGPLWEQFLKTCEEKVKTCEGQENTPRIFVLDNNTLSGDDAEKSSIIERVLQAHRERNVPFKVFSKDQVSRCWKKDHSTSFLLGGDFVSESYSLQDEGVTPGYVAKGEDNSRADELRNLWDCLSHERPEEEFAL